MKKYNLTNAQGLFYPFYLAPIMAQETTQKIRAKYLPSVTDPEEREALLNALELVEALPVIETVVRMKGAGKSKTVNAFKKAYGWLSLGSPESQSPPHPFPASSHKEAGWLDIGLIGKRHALINKMLRGIGEPDINPHSLTGAGNIKKRAASITFSEIAEFASLGESTSVAVFMTPNQGQEYILPGFLDSKGGLGPLSRARLFESAKAAERTLRMTSLTRSSAWKAVEVSLAATKALDMPGDTNTQAISQAIAQQESKALARALAEASLETLRARVLELEADAGIAPAAQRPRSRL